MPDNSKDIEYIDRFLRGELSETEEQAYQKRLTEDADFKKLHEEQKMIRDGIIRTSRQKMKDQLEAVEAELDAQEQRSSNGFWKYSRRMAAAFILLIIGAAVVYIYSSYNTTGQLYDTYFAPPTTIEVARGRGPAYGVNAAEAYNNGDYQNAEQLFEQALDEQRQSSILYYLAITKMRLEKFEEAEPLLNDVLADQTSFHSRARWHLALINIKLDRTDEAVSLLQELSTSTSDYREPAKNLLSEIQT